MHNTGSRVIQMFNTEYSIFKEKKDLSKEEKKGAFQTICQKVFDLYGQVEGFESVSQLKAYISKAKKQVFSTENLYVPKKKQEEITEGSGLEYTLLEIEHYNLNTDPYF